MIEVRHHLSRIYVGRDGVPEGAKVTAEVQQVPSHEDGLLAFDTILTITPRSKRYVLPMPDGTADESTRVTRVAMRYKDGGWHGSAYHYDVTASETPSYTKADIDASPDWVKALTPVEVTEDD